jgi:hypothetical protein
MLLEAVVMLISMIIAAKWAIRRFDVISTPGATIAMGVIALGLLLSAEFAGILWIRKLSVRDYLTTFLSPSGLVALLMFLLFGAMPTLVSRFPIAQGSAERHQRKMDRSSPRA